MTDKRAIIDADVDARAHEYGLDGPTLRRTRATLRSTEWAVSALVAIGAGVTLGVLFSRDAHIDIDFLRLLGTLAVGVVVDFILLYAGSFGARYLAGTVPKAAALGLASAAIVTSTYFIFAAFGWRVDVAVGLCIAALATLSLMLSTPSMALTILRANKPSLPAEMAHLLALPDWQTSLDGRSGRMVWLGALTVSGLIVEVVAVYLVPRATVAFAITSAAIAIAVYLLRRRPGTVLAVAALYPVLVAVLAVILA